MRPLFVCFTTLTLLGLIAKLELDVRADEDAAGDAPQEVTFDGQKMNLAWQGGEEGAPIYEYLPEGETLEQWKHLASIREWDAIDDAKELAANTEKTVKESYPGAPTQLIENPETGDTILDFIVGPEDGSFAEYNVFKYSQRDGGGVVAEQYALRAYGKQDIEAFLKKLPEVRSRVLDEMAATGLEKK